MCPLCLVWVSPAPTRQETEQLVSEAIVMHIEGLTEDGLPIPEPASVDIGHVELPRPA